MNQLTQLYAYIKQLADQDPLVNTVTKVDFNEIDLQKEIVFPLLNARIITGTFGTGQTINFNVQIGVFDIRDINKEIITDIFWEQDNEVDNHNTGVAVLNRLWLQMLRDFAENDITASENPSFELGYFEKAKLLDGVIITFDVEVPNTTISLCPEPEPAIPPEAPTDFLGGIATVNSVAMIWTKSITGPMLSYRVYIEGLRAGTFFGDIDSGILGGLNPDTIYEHVSIRAFDGLESEDSNLITIQTGPIPPSAPEPPTNLAAGAIGATTIAITWTKSVTGVMAEYRVYILGVLKETFTDEDQGLIRDLEPETLYESISVRAYDGSIESEDSNLIDVTTDPYTPIYGNELLLNPDFTDGSNNWTQRNQVTPVDVFDEVAYLGASGVCQQNDMDIDSVSTYKVEFNCKSTGGGHVTVLAVGLTDRIIFESETTNEWVRYEFEFDTPEVADILRWEESDQGTNMQLDVMSLKRKLN